MTDFGINLFQFDCYFPISSTSSSQTNRPMRFCVYQPKIFALSNLYFFQLLPLALLYFSALFKLLYTIWLKCIPQILLHHPSSPSLPWKSVKYVGLLRIYYPFRFKIQTLRFKLTPSKSLQCLQKKLINTNKYSNGGKIQIFPSLKSNLTLFWTRNTTLGPVSMKFSFKSKVKWEN